jgi:hypothetical protein
MESANLQIRRILGVCGCPGYKKNIQGLIDAKKTSLRINLLNG